MKCGVCGVEGPGNLCPDCRALMAGMFTPESDAPTESCKYCGGKINRPLHGLLGYICGCGSSWMSDEDSGVRSLEQMAAQAKDRLEKLADHLPMLPPPEKKWADPDPPVIVQPPLFLHSLPTVPVCPNCSIHRRCAACIAELAREDQERMETLRSQIARTA